MRKTAMLSIIVLIIMSFFLTACNKSDPVQNNVSVDIFGVHPHGGERCTVPQLNAIGPTDGIIAERAIVIDNITNYCTASLEDRWTLSNTTDEAITLTVAYPYSSQTIGVTVNGELTQTEQLYGCTSAVSGIPLETVRNLYADRSLLRDALIPSPELTENAVTYTFGNLSDSTGVGSYDDTITIIEFEYDPQVTNVYEYFTANTAFTKEYTDDSNTFIKFHIEKRSSSADDSDALYVIGEDIVNVSAFIIDDSGSPVDIDFTPTKEISIVSEMLYKLAEKFYLNKFGIDATTVDTSHTYIPFEQYYNAVCKKYVEFSQLGIPASDMSQKRESFNSFKSLYYYTDGYPFVTTKITIPGNGKTEIDIRYDIFGSTIEILAGKAADFMCESIDFSFISSPETELKWAESNMGLTETNGVYTALLDANTSTPWEPVYILMYATSINS